MNLPPLPTIPAGAKVAGINIGLKEDMTFVDMFSEWDWTGWFKRQVDLAVANLDVNCIRMIAGPAGCHPTINQYTSATHVARWVQFADYVQAQGLWLYPCLGSSARGGMGSLGGLDVKPYMLDLAAALDEYANVIAIDAYNEGEWDYLATGTLFDDLRAVTTKPLTLSQVCWGPEDWHNNNKWAAMRDFGDFYDFHFYSDPHPYHARNTLDTLTKPILFGEYGMFDNGDHAARRRRWYAVRSMHEIDGVVGTLRWAVIDEGVRMENAWGVFDINDQPRSFDVHVLSTFRQQRLVVP